MLRLYFKDRELGYIENMSVDWPWINGSFRPSLEGKKMADFFAFMANEDGDFDKDPPFPDDLLDDENWWVVEEDGRRRGISVPAIHDLDFAVWRWR